MASIRAAWPTSCCAVLRSHRYTRVSMRIAAQADERRQRRERPPHELLVGTSSARGSRAPPTNVRSSAMPAGARCGHFDDIHEPARIPECSARGTTNPEPLSGCAMSARRNASTIVAVEA